MKKNLSSSRSHAREIDFAQLPGDVLVEMVLDPLDHQKAMLAIYERGEVRYASKFQSNRCALVPRSNEDGILGHIHFADAAEKWIEHIGPLAEILVLLKNCLDVSIESQIAMAAFAMSTWFPEKMSFAPYLALVGPPGAGKTTALRVMSQLCRRGLLTADISSAAFYDICNRFSPTVLIDETLTAGNPRKLLHLLRASSSRGLVSLRKDNAQLAYGPKVLSWVQLPNDGQLCSRCLILPMHKSLRTDLIPPDDPRVLEIAARARRYLLQMRFEKFSQLSISDVPVDARLSGRALDIYRALALPLAEYPEFCGVLADLIVSQRQYQPEMLSSVQVSILRILHNVIHERPADGGLLINALTTAMNLDLESHGEPAGLNPRKVGDVLTSLGFTNRTRTNVGYVLHLGRSERLNIHRAVRGYAVDVLLGEPASDTSCELCLELSQPSSQKDTSLISRHIATSAAETSSERRELRARRANMRGRRGKQSGARSPIGPRRSNV